MSRLSGLKQQVNQIGDDASKTASGLLAFSSKFNSATAQIQQLIAGTAKGTDRELIAALQSADAAVKEAAQALHGASKSAKEWAQQA